MGASTSFRIYKASLGINAIKKLWMADVEQSLFEDGHSYSGEIGMLGPEIANWFDQDKTREEAYEFITSNHTKWRSAWAVSFILNDEKYWVIGGWCAS
jgi:fatty acid-binding protein DegV